MTPSSVIRTNLQHLLWCSVCVSVGYLYPTYFFSCLSFFHALHFAPRRSREWVSSVVYVYIMLVLYHLRIRSYYLIPGSRSHSVSVFLYVRCTTVYEEDNAPSSLPSHGDIQLHIQLLHQMETLFVCHTSSSMLASLVCSRVSITMYREQWWYSTCHCQWLLELAAVAYTGVATPLNSTHHTPLPCKLSICLTKHFIMHRERWFLADDVWMSAL